MAGSGIRFGDVIENGRVSEMSDSACESPVQLYIVTPWCNWSIMLEDRTCLKVEYMLELC